MKKNIFGENVENISLPKIDFDKAFKISVLLIGIIVIFQLKDLSDRIWYVERSIDYMGRDIVNELDNIKKRLN
jgi:hypothetical protein